MKAAYVSAPDILEMRDIPMPAINDGQALIEIVYAGVCGSDVVMYKGQHQTARPPVVLGHEIFGIVREIRPGGYPTDIRVGERVAAEPLLFCGVCEACRQGYGNVCGKLRLLGIHENGAYAQFVAAGVEKLVPMRTDIPDRFAALAEPFAVAYHVCMRAGLRAGEEALVVGGGPIGCVLAVAARAMGANVSLLEPNPKRLATALALGIPALNPAEDDVESFAERTTRGNGFDVVFEASGSKAGILSTTKLCKIHGTIVPLALSGAPVDFVLGQVSFKEQTVVGSRVYSFLHFKRGVEMLERLYASGVALEPLISDILPLDQAQRAIDMMIAGENACKILLDTTA